MTARGRPRKGPRRPRTVYAGRSIRCVPPRSSACVCSAFAAERRLQCTRRRNRLRSGARPRWWTPSCAPTRCAWAMPRSAAWARSAEFFDAATYPAIHYQSAPIPRAVLRDGGRVDGQLTLRGNTRAVGLRSKAATATPGCAASARSRSTARYGAPTSAWPVAGPRSATGSVCACASSPIPRAPGPPTTAPTGPEATIPHPRAACDDRRRMTASPNIADALRACARAAPGAGRAARSRWPRRRWGRRWRTLSYAELDRAATAGRGPRGDRHRRGRAQRC